MGVAGELDLHRAQADVRLVDLGTSESVRPHRVRVPGEPVGMQPQFDETPGAEYTVEGCTG